MTPDELRELLDDERSQEVGDLLDLRLADRLIGDNDNRRFRGGIL